MHATCIALAPAKVNLGLEVICKRPDGYHEVVTLLQSVSLFDRFVWTDTGKPFRYCSPAGMCQEDDIVARALDTSDRPSRWTGTLRLEKSIPTAAGLGGGSSDAALALQIAHPGLDNPALVGLAAGLGSDVPFFLDGGTALASGTGTRLEALPAPDLWFLIYTPAVSIASKTAAMYKSLSQADMSDGSTVRHIASCLKAPCVLEIAPPNAFARALLEYTEVEHAWDCLIKAGAPWVGVAGAGPSLFTIARTFHEADAIRKRLSGDLGPVELALSLPANAHLPFVRKLTQALEGGTKSR